MTRKGKKTLYLDLDAIESIERSLSQMPGNPSVSSYINEALPALASSLELIVAESKKSTLRGAAKALMLAADELDQARDMAKDIEKDTNSNFDKSLDELKDIPPKEISSSGSKL